MPLDLTTVSSAIGLCDSKELKRRAGKADQSRGRPIRLPSGDRSLGAVAARCRHIRGFHFVLHAHGYVEWTSACAYHTGCIVGSEARSEERRVGKECFSTCRS